MPRALHRLVDKALIRVQRKLGRERWERWRASQLLVPAPQAGDLPALEATA